jgi:hypothetical protein
VRVCVCVRGRARVCGREGKFAGAGGGGPSARSQEWECVYDHVCGCEVECMSAFRRVRVLV